MTESEAIKSLTTIAEIIPGYCRSGAFSVAIEALEKQVAKEVTNKFTDLDEEGFEVEFGGCPNCKMEVNFDDNEYCPYCGQRLDWGD